MLLLSFSVTFHFTSDSESVTLFSLPSSVAAVAAVASRAKTRDLIRAGIRLTAIDARFRDASPDCWPLAVSLSRLHMLSRHSSRGPLLVTLQSILLILIKAIA